MAPCDWVVLFGRCAASSSFTMIRSWSRARVYGRADTPSREHRLHVSPLSSSSGFCSREDYASNTRLRRIRHFSFIRAISRFLQCSFSNMVFQYPRLTPNRATPFREAQGPEQAEGERTAKVHVAPLPAGSIPAKSQTRRGEPSLVLFSVDVQNVSAI